MLIVDYSFNSSMLLSPGISSAWYYLLACVVGDQRGPWSSAVEIPLIWLEYSLDTVDKS
jgi:hypothetical protein